MSCLNFKRGHHNIKMLKEKLDYKRLYLINKLDNYIYYLENLSLVEVAGPLCLKEGA